MNTWTHRSVLAVATLIVVLAGSALVGCSKGGPTDPSGGGPSGGPGGEPGGGAQTLDSGILNASDDFVVTFATTDTIPYHCEFHVDMGMVGTVRVAAGGADSIAVAANGMSFAPPIVTIRPGGRVRWHMVDGPHTVTSD